MEEEYIKVNRDAYNKFAVQHNQRTTNPSKAELSDDDWEKILSEHVILKKDSRVLEIGPGTGRLLKIMEEKLDAKTIAVELSHEMISYAKEKSPNTIYIEDNILEVPFSNQCFDSIIMGALIHNFPKKDAIELLKKTYQWLKDDGRIMIYTTLHEKSEEGYSVKEDYQESIVRFRKKYTEEELQNLLEENQFKITYKMINEEKDRNKKWIIYVVEKNL